MAKLPCDLGATPLPAAESGMGVNCVCLHPQPAQAILDAGCLAEGRAFVDVKPGGSHVFYCTSRDAVEPASRSLTAPADRLAPIASTICCWIAPRPKCVCAVQGCVCAVEDFPLKSHRSRKAADSLETMFGEKLHRASWDKQAQRKARQLCRQVQRALNLALSDYGGVFVEEVTPAPDCGRLLVFVAIGDGRPVAEVLGVLRREAPRLRSEVARAITRKRAPELAFVPAFPEGGEDV